MVTSHPTPFAGPALRLNPWSEAHILLHEPFMRHAFAAGTVVAVLAGVVGFFVVLRRTSFAAHALSHVGFAGATGAVVVGASAVSGLLVFTVLGAVVMGAMGHRLRNRDATIGIVLAWMLGLGVLFLSLYTGYATEAYALLFGEILGISVHDVTITVVASAVVLVAVAACYRPLLFSSLDEDVAEARGVPVRALSVAFMVMLGLTTAAAVQVVGVLLIFALLITPPAIAERLARRPGRAILVSVGFSLLFTWAGLSIAYYSPYPVSFWITTMAFGTYVLVRAATWLLGHRGGAAALSMV